jgi:hypothetical protein
MPKPSKPQLVIKHNPQKHWLKNNSEAPTQICEGGAFWKTLNIQVVGSAHWGWTLPARGYCWRCGSKSCQGFLNEAPTSRLELRCDDSTNVPWSSLFRRTAKPHSGPMAGVGPHHWWRLIQARKPKAAPPPRIVRGAEMPKAPRWRCHGKGHTLTCYWLGMEIHVNYKSL